MKRTFHKLLVIARRIVRILFYSTLALVWLLILLYLVAAIWTGVLIWQSGQMSWANLPNALGQALRPAFLATTITTWQTALVELALYIVAFVLTIMLTRLVFTTGKVKQYVDPGDGPILLSDIWFEPEAAQAPPQTRWRLPWRHAHDAPGQGALGRDGARPGAAKPDPLGYSTIANSIADTIMRSAQESPYAIAIEGRWGVGKTTVMRMVEKRLKGDYSGNYFNLTENDSPTKWKNFTIWFNPWRHKHRDVQKAFMSAVFAEVPWRALSWYSSKFMRRRLLRVGGLVLTFLRGGRTKTSKRIANQLDISAPYRNQFQTDFQQFLHYWSHAESDTRVNLVVFVDDLDRCTPAEIGPTLEAMKLFFESKNCVFVLGFDPYYVARSIKKGSHGMIRDGLTYLQKLVQVEYRIPQPTDERLGRLLDGYTDKSRLGVYFERIRSAVTDYREVILECTHRTPREMKLLINGLVIALPLLQPEDYVTAFFLLLLQLCWPKTYRRIIETSQQHDAQATVERLRRGSS